MALVLTLKQGQGFRVGQHDFVVHTIASATEFVLRHASGLYVHINHKLAKIADGIWIRAGTRGQLTLARICVEADETLPITRH